MTDTLGISGLIAGIVSIVLGLIAIGISLYFYTQGKNTETQVKGLLEAIRAQTDMLQKIVGRQMDRLIRGVVEQQPAPQADLVSEMIEALKDIPTTVITLLQTPKPTADAATAQAAHFWRQEAIRGYIGAYYYAAMTNMANQAFLPPIESLGPGNIFKRVIDLSHADFFMLDRWFATLDPEELRQSNLYHLYEEASNSFRQFIKDSTTVYADRATPVAAQSAR